MTVKDNAPPAPSLLRSGALMALGTIASRGTGFLKTAMLVAALGVSRVGDAYNIANTIPNNIYDMLMGGILTSVIVPLIVRARERDREYADDYEQRLFTATVLALAVLTVVAVLLAPYVISLWGAGLTKDARPLGVEFARFFLPQIFFYGVGAFAGAILNTRHRFAAPMWAPVLNNLVVIAVCGLFISISTGAVTPTSMTANERLLMEVGTTGGIVLQTLVLWPSLRAAGFRWRPRLGFQPGELATIGRAAGWTLVYVAAFQAAFLVNSALLSLAGANGAEHGYPDAGFSPYANAYQLLQLPYAIVAVSVITALLPRMSGHATGQRHDLVRDDLSTGLRLSSVIILPVAVLMLTLAPQIATVMFDHGNTGSAGAAVIAGILAVFAIGVWPFSTYQLMLRVFYAYRDTRTPALIGLATAGTGAIISVLIYETVPVQHVAQGLALGFALSNVLAVALCAVILRFRLKRLDGTRIIVSHLRIVGAVLPLAVLAVAVRYGLGNIVGDGFTGALAVLAVTTLAGIPLYVVAARILGVSEVGAFTNTIAARFGGRSR